jgi:glycosyltransferase involved in cell wall biosynthesis
VRILYLDPFHAGSHAAVAEGYTARSRHDVTLLTLSIAGGWRWRMRGAAVTLARVLREQPRDRFDLVVATDMLDLATFLGLARRETAGVPVALYMHENQLTYPLPPGRRRDLAFPWINYTACLAADAIFFNSDFHRRAFLAALPALPGRFHDHQELDLIATIAAKARVLPPGINLARLEPRGGVGEVAPPPQKPARPDEVGPIILWNSRWEYDKNPAAFFAALRELEARAVDFRVIVAGEAIDPNEPSFVAAREWLRPHTLHWGYAPDLATYRRLLHTADVVVSTAEQEFFGIAVIEAMYCGCAPILPRRLSYPDLLPPALHAACLYDDQAGLVERLLAASHSPFVSRDTARALAAPYDWSSLVAQYDAEFERVVNESQRRDVIQ